MTGKATPNARGYVVIVVKTSVGGLWIVPQAEALASAGEAVLVVLPAGGGALSDRLADARIKTEETTFDFRFIPTPSRVRAFMRFRRQLRSAHADVFLYHLYASALAVRLATLRLGVPRVHMVPGPLYLESRLIRTVERSMNRLDSLIIAGSQYTYERYRELGRPSATLLAIPYGVNTEHFRPATPSERSAARRRLEVPDETFVAVMVAYFYAPKRLTYKGVGIKGHDVLVAAWQDFRRDHQNSHLFLVGSGFDTAGDQHRAKLMADITSQGSQGITWLPTTSDVRRFYAAADVSVCPSLSENHGAALEATAMGVPCIVSDAGGLPETVDNTSGWVTRRGDAVGLSRALSAAYGAWSDGSLMAMRQAARDRAVRLFDQESCVERVAAAVRSGHRAIGRS